MNDQWGHLEITEVVLVPGVRLLMPHYPLPKTVRISIEVMNYKGIMGLLVDLGYLPGVTFGTGPDASMLWLLR